VPKTQGILESSLYVSDVPRSVRFYEETFGFRVIKEFGARGCAMHTAEGQVLLPKLCTQFDLWWLRVGFGSHGVCVSSRLIVPA